MIVSYESLVGALGNVRSLASDLKNSPSVLCKFQPGVVHMCHSDGKNNIIREIVGEPEEGDIQADVVIKLERLKEVIDLCAPGSNLKTDDLHITLDGVDQLKVVTNKYYEFSRDNETVERKTVSNINRSVKYSNIEDDMRYQLLSRMNYTDIFSSEKGYDTWDTPYLCEVIKRSGANEPKTIFLSSVKKLAFAINGDKSSLTCSNIDESAVNLCQGFTLSSRVAKYLVEILSKLPDESVQVAVEDTRYCKIKTDDCSLGIQFELAPSTSIEQNTLGRYTTTEYKDYELVFNRFAFADFVKGVVTTDKEDDAVIKFVLNEESLSMCTERGRLDNSNTGLTVVAEDYTDYAGDLLTKELEINFRILSSLVGNCKENFIVIKFCNLPSGHLIQIMDSQGKTEDGEILASVSHYMAVK